MSGPRQATIPDPLDCPRCGARRERFTTDEGTTITACPGCGQYEQHTPRQRGKVWPDG